jgi:hypothetical protein
MNARRGSNTSTDWMTDWLTVSREVTWPGITPPMLYSYLHLHVALTGKTNGRHFELQCSFVNRRTLHRTAHTLHRTARTLHRTARTLHRTAHTFTYSLKRQSTLWPIVLRDKRLPEAVSLGVKRAEPKADNLFQNNTDVKNEWSLTFTQWHVLLTWCIIHLQFYIYYRRVG